jgi:NAD(P)-dependent dehydrogenase (short-subunit alcohol dehydrogenase family)
MTHVAYRFSGCTVIVTGGGAGIGRATWNALSPKVPA